MEEQATPGNHGLEIPEKSSRAIAAGLTGKLELDTLAPALHAHDQG